MHDLVKQKTKKIDVKAEKDQIMYVGELEAKLLEFYPASDACEWDKTGLLVGDSRDRIQRVAVALDPTIQAINAAKSANANVLLTHHPAYRSGVEGFYPEQNVGMTTGSVVYEAIRNNVALMNFHTALDVSADAQRVLPSLLHLDPLKGSRIVNGSKVKMRVLVPNENSKTKGFGQVCTTSSDVTLKEMAARCTSVFGRAPRVWGNMSKSAKKIVTATGSASNLIDECMKTKVDLLIAGEVRYHDALRALESGLSIIDLGHDVSELPLAAVLANACKKAGLKSSKIVILDQSHNWQQTSSITI